MVLLLQCILQLTLFGSLILSVVGQKTWAHYTLFRDSPAQKVEPAEAQAWAPESCPQVSTVNYKKRKYRWVLRDWKRTLKRQSPKPYHQLDENKKMTVVSEAFLKFSKENFVLAPQIDEMEKPHRKVIQRLLERVGWPASEEKLPLWIEQRPKLAQQLLNLICEDKEDCVAKGWANRWKEAKEQTYNLVRKLVLLDLLDGMTLKEAIESRWLPTKQVQARLFRSLMGEDGQTHDLHWAVSRRHIQAACQAKPWSVAVPETFLLVSSYQNSTTFVEIFNEPDLRAVPLIEERKNVELRGEKWLIVSEIGLPDSAGRKPTSVQEKKSRAPLCFISKQKKLDYLCQLREGLDDEKHSSSR